MRNQIRSGLKGGLMVGTASQGAHHTATRTTGIRSREPLRSTCRCAMERSTLMTVATVPAIASHAVTRSSVSVIGVVGRSHLSKHSSVGVNATSRKNKHAANWTMRLATVSSIGSAEFARKARPPRLRPISMAARPNIPHSGIPRPRFLLWQRRNAVIMGIGTISRSRPHS